MYKIATAEGLDELEDVVNSAIQMGYEPIGGVTKTQAGYIQAVYSQTKPKATKKKTKTISKRK